MKPAESSTDAATMNEVKVAWQAAEEAVNKLRDASTEADTFKALADVRTAAKGLIDTKFYENQVASWQQWAQGVMNQLYHDELVTPDSGWGRLREALKRPA